ncbi:hypothetical protein J5N97_011928 [Dioscorea zingiberensis]|uniref:Uncharacterized protein n=1 Tax=Dioscorea zingiberensis TaxID=325984 RepID=A0A9D5HP27_9LILI|nr:hypothetical protein J5N97_011928 [Dioscorea zingiberensis]
MKLARSRSRNRVFPLLRRAPASDDNDVNRSLRALQNRPGQYPMKSRPLLGAFCRSRPLPRADQGLPLRRLRLRPGAGGGLEAVRALTIDPSTGSSSRSVDDDDQSDGFYGSDLPLSSSLSSSSSSSSSSVLSSSAGPPLPPPECKHRRRVAPERSETRKALSTRENYHPATGLCLLVISFCVLLSFGRLCAIPWAATCLYFTPRRKYGGGGSRPRACDVDVGKKRVVLEGLLERNQRA